MKVVKNADFGGYVLSRAALVRISELTGKNYAQCVEDYRWGNYASRTDPAVIQAVEELGSAANDLCANLVVVDVPDDVEWIITDYDGLETIEEVHRTW